MQPKKIHYAGPWITAAEVDAVREAVLNGFYENYRCHKQALEAEVSRLIGARFAVATSCCTGALHLAVAALGLKEGDEVITTDSSCVASALPIAYAGAKAVFADIDPDTWLISPEAIRRAITSRTRALLVVHWNGHPCPMTEIGAIASEYGLRVIEDGAPALGAEYGQRKVGSIGDVGCFSFQGAKVAIGGEGGILVTNDESIVERARILGSFGRTDSVTQYWSDYIGFNYPMPNLAAALALAQVRRLGELIEKKRAIFRWYEEGLAGVEQIKLIREAPGTRSTYCYPCMLLADSAPLTRGELLDALARSNIDSRPAQPSISCMPMFERRFSNPESDRVTARGVILPGAFRLTRDDVAFVCESIRELLAR